MNNIIETMLNHRSIRQYEDRPLSEEQIMTIVRCAQAASTSSYIQAYSIIGITDKETKRKLAELCGNQPYVETNGHLFVFCADLHRHQVIAEMEGQDLSPAIESTEKFMVAVIDATLAAQNAALAAESMGLGICYIGGLRNQLQAVTELLDIPTHVMPLFAMTVGYPLQEYNATISSYYQERTQGERSDTWTGQMANMLSKPARMYMKEFVEKQGLNKK